MLLTHSQKDLITQRIQPIVSFLMEEEPLFKENLDHQKMVEHLIYLFEKNLSFEEFKAMSDEDLKERCDGIMAIELLTKSGEKWTPEEIAIFDGAVKRK
jgi:hypothetical protein